MRIDVPLSDAWERLSEHYRAALPLGESALNVQVYAGVGHAVHEITRSLAKLYTHKKTIAVISGVDPTFVKVAIAFSEDEYVVKNVTVAEALRPETWEPLQNDLLFVLTSTDDPVTGRLYPFDEAPWTGKRVFRIHVSHEAHRHQPVVKLDPFMVNILSLSPNRALMIAGVRVKIEPSLAPWLHWPVESPNEIAASLTPSEGAVSRAAIEDFESHLPGGFQSYFRPGEARLFDRVVVYHPALDGLAVIDELSQRLAIPIEAPGERSLLETTSGCRWESPRFNDWLISRGETIETVRGLIILSSSLIENGLREHLETAAAKIMRLQSGDGFPER